MEIVYIPPDIIGRSKKEVEKRINFEYNRFNLNELQRKSMIQIGLIGEMVFENYLKSNNIDYKYSHLIGDFDTFDFIVDGEKIEIKTSGFDTDFNNLNLLYNVDQFRHGFFKNFKYVCLIFINGYDRYLKILDNNFCNIGFIMGFINYNHIQNYNIINLNGNSCFKIPISELVDIKNLFL